MLTMVESLAELKDRFSVSPWLFARPDFLKQLAIIGKANHVELSDQVRRNTVLNVIVIDDPAVENASKAIFHESQRRKCPALILPELHPRLS